MTSSGMASSISWLESPKNARKKLDICDLQSGGQSGKGTDMIHSAWCWDYCIVVTTVSRRTMSYLRGWNLTDDDLAWHLLVKVCVAPSGICELGFILNKTDMR